MERSLLSTAIDAPTLDRSVLGLGPRAFVLSCLLTACGQHALARQVPEPPDLAGFVRVEPVAVDAQGAAVVARANVTLDEERVAAVISPVQGRVTRLLVGVGDHVSAGAPLASVYSAEVAGAGAALSQARISRMSAEQSLARAERLAAEGAGSQREVLDARTALAGARAEEARARAVLQSIGASGAADGVYTLRAPTAGTVVRRALRVGAQARPDDAEPAFLIADLDQVWVVARLHESQGAAVRAGDRAEIDVPAAPGRRFVSVVDRVAEAVDPDTHTLSVRICVPNVDRALKPDMLARVTVRTGSTDVPLVPLTALITDAEGYAAFVEVAGRFERRRVVVGAEFDGRAQVRDGLRAGDRVVVEGALLLDASADRAL